MKDSTESGRSEYDLKIAILDTAMELVSKHPSSGEDPRCHEEIGGVGANHEKNEPHRSQQQPQCRAHVTHHIVHVRPHEEEVPGMNIGKIRLPPRHHRSQLDLGVFQCLPRRESCHGAEEMILAGVSAGLVQLKRRPELNTGIWKRKTRWHDAHDLARQSA